MDINCRLQLFYLSYTNPSDALITLRLLAKDSIMIYYVFLSIRIDHLILGKSNGSKQINPVIKIIVSASP